MKKSPTTGNLPSLSPPLKPLRPGAVSKSPSIPVTGKSFPRHRDSKNYVFKKRMKELEQRLVKSNDWKILKPVLKDMWGKAVNIKIGKLALKKFLDCAKLTQSSKEYRMMVKLYMDLVDSIWKAGRHELYILILDADSIFKFLMESYLDQKESDLEAKYSDTLKGIKLWLSHDRNEDYGGSAAFLSLDFKQGLEIEGCRACLRLFDMNIKKGKSVKSYVGRDVFTITNHITSKRIRSLYALAGKVVDAILDDESNKSEEFYRKLQKLRSLLSAHK